MVHSEEERRKILGRTKGHCAYCREPIDSDEDWDEAHIVSRHMLERLKLENLAERLPIYLPAHPDCNRADHRTILGIGKVAERLLPEGMRSGIAYDRDKHSWEFTYPEKFYAKRKVKK